MCFTLIPTDTLLLSGLGNNKETFKYTWDKKKSWQSNAGKYIIYIGITFLTLLHEKMHVNEHQGFLCFCCLFPPLLRWGYFIRLNWNWVRKWVKCVRGRIDITCFSIPVSNLIYCGLYKWCSVFLNRSVVVYETSHANHLIFIPIPPFHSTNDLKNIVCKQRKTKTVQPFKCNKKTASEIV